MSRLQDRTSCRKNWSGHLDQQGLENRHCELLVHVLVLLVRRPRSDVVPWIDATERGRCSGSVSSFAFDFPPNAARWLQRHFDRSDQTRAVRIASQTCSVDIVGRSVHDNVLRRREGLRTSLGGARKVIRADGRHRDGFSRETTRAYGGSRGG
jgi:hypothetical protein